MNDATSTTLSSLSGFLRDRCLVVQGTTGNAVLWHIDSLTLFRLDRQHTRALRWIMRTEHPARQTTADRNHDAVASILDNLSPLMEEHEDARAPILRRLNLLVSQQCMLSCRYCYAQHGTYGRASLMSNEVVARALDQFAGQFTKIESLQFFGGEPMLNMAAIRAAIDHALHLVGKGDLTTKPEFSIVTNLCADKPEMEQLVHLLKQPIHLRIMVSCDGPAEIHDRLRRFRNGAPSFDVLRQNCELIRPYGQPASVEATYTRLHLTRGITPSELQFRIADQLAVEQVVIVPVVTRDKELRIPPSMLPAIVNDRLKRGLELASACCTEERKSGARLLRSYIQQVRTATPRMHFCDLGTANFTVATDGSVYPCQLMVGRDNGRSRIGSVFDPPSVFQQRMRQATGRYDALTAKRRYPECAACFLRNYCTGCPAGEYMQSGSFTVSLTGCAARRSLMKRLLRHIADNGYAAKEEK